jgi:hypothetical protein
MMSDSTIRPYWGICRRVYLVWAIMILIGFIATHFYQIPNINNLWLILSAIGLGYMGFSLKQLQFRDPMLAMIGLLWLFTIAFGLMISILTFVIEPLAELSLYLGIFWLGLMGLAHLFNGVVDRSYIYWLTGSAQILTGVLCFALEPLQSLQYLIAGLIGSAAMVALILFR